MGLIRLLLAISVVLAHSSAILGSNLVAGQAAVQTFYMISGFYMALVLHEKYAPTLGGYRLFLGNRILRLFPAYLFVLAGTLAAQAFIPGAFTGPQNTLRLWVEHMPHMSWTTLLALLLPNLLIVGQDAIAFLALDPASGSLYVAKDIYAAALPGYRFLVIPQAWSLGVELLFYAVAPLLVRKRPGVLAAFVIASIGVRAYLWLGCGLYHDPWNYRFFPSELAFFLTGALGYRFYVYMSRSAMPPRWLMRAALAAVVAAMLAFAFVPIPGKRVGFYALAAAALPLLFMLTHRSRLDRYVGELSYPLYICHVTLAMMLASVGLNRGVILTPLAIAVSVGLFWLVDRPIDRLRHRWSQVRVDENSAVALNGAR